MYYIYHIKGIKIGCTKHPKRRVKEQGYSEYSILECNKDIMIISKRELQLQKEYGYKTDATPYYNTIKAPNTESSKKWAKKLGSIQGKINVESGHLDKVRNPSAAGKAASIKNNHITKQTYICPHCNKIGKSGAMKQWHFDRCRFIK